MIYVVSDFSQIVRDYMRDKLQLNRLLHALESENISYQLSMELTADEWNTTPPLISTITFSVSGGVDIVNVPKQLKHLLFLGTVTHLMESVLFIRGRNALSYTDGGVTVNDDAGPFSSYLQIYNLLQRRYEKSMLNLKTLENINGLLDGSGGIGTDYSFLPYWETI